MNELKINTAKIKEILEKIKIAELRARLNLIEFETGAKKEISQRSKTILERDKTKDLLSSIEKLNDMFTTISGQISDIEKSLDEYERFLQDEHKINITLAKEMKDSYFEYVIDVKSEMYSFERTLAHTSDLIKSLKIFDTASELNKNLSTLGATTDTLQSKSFTYAQIGENTQNNDNNNQQGA